MLNSVQNNLQFASPAPNAQEKECYFTEDFFIFLPSLLQCFFVTDHDMDGFPTNPKLSYVKN